MTAENQGVRPGERIEDMDVSSEMDTSFLEYAMSVIVARALPDVRDGLKPVHRRILYTMFSSGMRPDSPYKKSARTVGSVIGKFHPHGDSAVYEAMVRLAQSWSMRLPLIDGHGNFGSLDDGPAAMRYTEARLAPAAMLMLEELGEETVDFVPNYDGTEKEPAVLPSLIPNLLVNGSTGIAVGMATNMPPHNLGEVLQLLQRLLEDPSVKDEELLELLPGPDFPSGGSVLLGDGYRSAFLTGQGTVTLRARTEITEVGRRRQGIVVTELPYTVGPEKVIARIKELSAAKRLQGVADVKDFSDRRTGMRLVIECKSGFAPEQLLEDLFRLTPLQENFSINNVALVDGVPQTLGVRRMAELFLAHRRSTVTRRSNFRLARAEERSHIVEGLLKALSALDEVIAIVRAAKDADTARKKLMESLALSERQANAVLEMTIRRLTGLERTKLEKELKELQREMDTLRKLLDSPRLLDRLIGKELLSLGEQHATPRASTLLREAPPAPSQTRTLSAQASDDPCRVLLSPSGTLLRTGPDGSPLLAVSALHTTLTAPVGLLFPDGSLLRLPAADVLPDAGSSAAALLPGRGVPVALLDLRAGRRCLLVTAAGQVKAFETDLLPQRGDVRPVIRLADGDRVVAGFTDPGTEQEPSLLLLISSQGRGLLFPAGSVASKGLSAGGMAGMRLPDGARVLTAAPVLPSGPASVYALVTSAGRVKTSAVEEVPSKGRGTGGVMLLAFRKGEEALASAWVSAGDPAPLSARGAKVAARVAQSPRTSSASEPSKPVASFCSEV